MHNTEFVTFSQEFTYGFLRMDNSLIANSNISEELLGFISKILRYLWQHPNTNVTQKLYRAEINPNASERETRKLFRLAEISGLLTHTKIYPHAQTDKDSIYAKHNIIQHLYHFYDNISNNKKFKKEQYKIQCEEKRKAYMITNQNAKKLLKEELNKPKIETQPIIQQEKTADYSFYESAKNTFNDSVFTDLSKQIIKVEMSDEVREYLNKEDIDFTDPHNMDAFIDTCWNVIVMSMAYNEKGFNSFRYSEAGKKMAVIGTKAIKESFENLKIYQPEQSSLYGIKNGNVFENIILNKLLLLYNSITISNFVKWGFLLDENKKKRLPDYRELRGLYKTLANHQELIYLKNNTTEYNLLNEFFKRNQDTYNRE